MYELVDNYKHIVKILYAADRSCDFLQFLLGNPIMRMSDHISVERVLLISAEVRELVRGSGG